MILGIGVDIAEVSRITKSVSDGDFFKKRIFTKTEQNYCDKLKNFGQSYAARYAAKEAFFKAIGTGWRGELKFTEVEVENDKLGKPFLNLYGKALRITKKMGVKQAHISLSHTKETAIAYVILESQC